MQTKADFMIFPSLSQNLIREVSFFSKKSKTFDFEYPSQSLFLFLAASLIKSAIKPPKKVANAYSIFYMEKYPEFKDSSELILLFLNFLFCLRS